MGVHVLDNFLHFFLVLNSLWVGIIEYFKVLTFWYHLQLQWICPILTIFGDKKCKGKWATRLTLMILYSNPGMPLSKKINK